MHFIKSYTAGEEAQWKGASMHSDWIRRPPPVYVACNGPKACHLAGEIADGSTIAGAIDPQIMKWKIELITKGARETPQAATSALPLFNTTTSRSIARERNETTSPSRHISVRIVSPGNTGAENRRARARNRSTS